MLVARMQMLKLGGNDVDYDDGDADAFVDDVGFILSYETGDDWGGADGADDRYLFSFRSFYLTSGLVLAVWSFC